MAKKLGMRPGSKFQIDLKGNVIILTKIEENQGNRETIDVQGIMKLSEVSLKGFLENEPDLYSDADVKVKYK